MVDTDARMVLQVSGAKRCAMQTKLPAAQMSQERQHVHFQLCSCHRRSATDSVACSGERDINNHTYALRHKSVGHMQPGPDRFCKGEKDKALAVADVPDSTKGCIKLARLAALMLCVRSIPEASLLMAESIPCKGQISE